MKHIHFDVESDGFYGAYWACKDGSDCAVIAMLGDDPEDYMARSAVKWLLRLGVNVLTMSPGKKDYGHHNYPLLSNQIRVRHVNPLVLSSSWKFAPSSGRSRERAKIASIDVPRRARNGGGFSPIF